MVGLEGKRERELERKGTDRDGWEDKWKEGRFGAINI